MTISPWSFCIKTNTFSSFLPIHSPHAANFIFLKYSPDSASSINKNLCSFLLPAEQGPDSYFVFWDSLGWDSVEGTGNPLQYSCLEKSHGWRSLVGYSPWGRKESDTTEQLHFHFSLSCIREGNGNPLQCSCLENPRDGGAWWAAVYGVTQSPTRLKWPSRSSSHIHEALV